MNHLVAKLQKDVEKLQQTILRESNELLERVRNADLKADLRDNIDLKRKEIEKTISNKLKRLEPAYRQFMDELRKNARKAGIDIDKIEKEILERAGARLQKVAGTRSAGKAAGKKVTKSAKKKATQVKKTYGPAGKTTSKSVAKKRSIRSGTRSPGTSGTKKKSS